MGEGSVETQQLEKIHSFILSIEADLGLNRDSGCTPSAEAANALGLREGNEKDFEEYLAASEPEKLERLFPGSLPARVKAQAFGMLLELSIVRLIIAIKENGDKNSITRRACAVHRLIRLFGNYFTFSEFCLKSLCMALSVQSLPHDASGMLAESIGIFTLLKDPRVLDRLIHFGVVKTAIRHIKQCLKEACNTESSDDSNEEESPLKKALDETDTHVKKTERASKPSAKAPGRKLKDDQLLSGCLWTLCNVSLNADSHSDLIREKAPKLLTSIITTVPITSLIEYSLCILARLFYM